jgi:hypothetical protein
MRIELFGLDAAARTLIDAKEVRTKGINHLLVPDLKILVAWKRGLKTVSLKKEELKKAWNDEPEPEPVQAWSEADELELNKMHQPITVGETKMGSEFKKMVDAVLNSPELLTGEQMEGLERAIRDRSNLDAQRMNAEQATLRDAERVRRGAEGTDLETAHDTAEGTDVVRAHDTAEGGDEHS